MKRLLEKVVDAAHKGRLKRGSQIMSHLYTEDAPARCKNPVQLCLSRASNSIAVLSLKTEPEPNSYSCARVALQAFVTGPGAFSQPKLW